MDKSKQTNTARGTTGSSGILGLPHGVSMGTCACGATPMESLAVWTASRWMVTVVRPTHQTISLHVANVGSPQIQPTLQVLSSVRLPNRRIQLWVLQRAR